MRFPARVTVSLAAAAALSVGVLQLVQPASAATHGKAAPPGPGGPGPATQTPIKHLVVIFDENVSFDHYFGTYPYATNPSGEPAFTAAPGTPNVSGLYNQVTGGVPTGPLLTNNPNLSNPMLLGRSDALTCDQDHGYTHEQQAADFGAEDLYVQKTGKSTTLAACLAGRGEPIPAGASTNYAVMDYYDGNTVTALWNYAQHFAMSDGAFGTGYGPSTPGALNVTSAQTYGATCGPSFATINDSACANPPGYDSSDVVDSDLTTTGAPTAAGAGTTYSDADPTYDICSYLPSADGGDNNAPANTLGMGGPNIGTELSSAGITWGWFEGGFDDGYVPGPGTTPPTTAQICSETHQNIGGSTVVDYIPHHEPFQYYASTANPMHLPPTSVAMIGQSDQANHQYDLADFWAAADNGNLPAVSFLKAAAYQDGHAGYSDPLDEQTFLVNTINRLEKLPTWKSTAVVITWDDSDGWYDHVLGPVVSGSQSSIDALTGTNTCGSASIVPQTSGATPEEGKCGLGPRLPFLVVSPFSRSNYVDDTLIDQSSVVKFIESNWGLSPLGNGAADTAAGSIDSMFDFAAGPGPGHGGPPNPPLYLDPTTGEPTGPPPPPPHH